MMYIIYSIYNACTSVNKNTHTCIHILKKIGRSLELAIIIQFVIFVEGKYIKISRYFTSTIFHTFLPSDGSTTWRWLMSRTCQCVFLWRNERTFACLWLWGLRSALGRRVTICGLSFLWFPPRHRPEDSLHDQQRWQWSPSADAGGHSKVRVSWLWHPPASLQADGQSWPKRY